MGQYYHIVFKIVISQHASREEGLDRLSEALLGQRLGYREYFKELL